VKGSELNNKLTHKDALLKIAINTNVSRVPNFGIKSFSTLLSTKGTNIYHALVRRQSLQAFVASIHPIP
jgi:hypothetical protein